MTAEFKPNPNLEKELGPEVVKNLTPTLEEALAGVTCPDHGEHPTLTVEGEGWKVGGCCEKGIELGTEAISKVMNDYSGRVPTHRIPTHSAN
jgi:hypothetical protein